MDIDLNTVLTFLLICIIFLLFLKSERKCAQTCEKYTENSYVDEDMHMNESTRIMNSCKFSLECCPSIYSNDRGCMCMDKKQEEIMKTRGYNKTHVDGFGY